MQTFLKRRLKITFRLGEGVFNNNNDVVEIINLAIRSTISVYGKGTSKAKIEVTGLSQEIIQKLVVQKSTVVANAYQRNHVTLTINENNNNESIIFSGYIFFAFADFNRAPDIPLIIHASSLYNALMTVPKPRTFKGAMAVSYIMQQLATEAGYPLYNHGVTAEVRDLSLNGDLRSMMEKVCEISGASLYMDINTIQISPKGQPRGDIPDLKISRETGMQGYPTPIEFGALVSCLYDYRFRILGKVYLEVPEIPLINGPMFISSITNRIDSEVPMGRWNSEMKLLSYNLGQN